MAEDEERLSLKCVSVKRKDDTITQDLKDGYAFFSVFVEVNGRHLDIKKKVRLDKPDKMLHKFMTKIPMLAEEKYKEVKYFVADKTPPSSFDTDFTNEDSVADKMLLMFEEIDQFMKTGKFEVLATDKIVF